MSILSQRWIRCCLLLLGIQCGLHDGFAVAVEPQNLLIIQTDEHHFNTLGCYGGKIVATPNIDWIANNGALCSSFYATTPRLFAIAGLAGFWPVPSENAGHYEQHSA